MMKAMEEEEVQVEVESKAQLEEEIVAVQAKESLQLPFHPEKTLTR